MVKNGCEDLSHSLQIKKIPSVLYLSLTTLIIRLAILRVHSHGSITIDLQCYEEDNITDLDNVSVIKKLHSTEFIMHRKCKSIVRECDIYSLIKCTFTALQWDYVIFCRISWRYYVAALVQVESTKRPKGSATAICCSQSAISNCVVASAVHSEKTKKIQTFNSRFASGN